jgi:hypothetical protein
MVAEVVCMRVLLVEDEIKMSRALRGGWSRRATPSTPRSKASGESSNGST